MVPPLIAVALKETIPSINALKYLILSLLIESSKSLNVPEYPFLDDNFAS